MSICLLDVEPLIVPILVAIFGVISIGNQRSHILKIEMAFLAWNFKSHLRPSDLQVIISQTHMVQNRIEQFLNRMDNELENQTQNDVASIFGTFISWICPWGKPDRTLSTLINEDIYKWGSRAFFKVHPLKKNIPWDYYLYAVNRRIRSSVICSMC